MKDLPKILKMGLQAQTYLKNLVCSAPSVQDDYDVDEVLCNYGRMMVSHTKLEHVLMKTPSQNLSTIYNQIVTTNEDLEKKFWPIVCHFCTRKLIQVNKKITQTNLDKVSILFMQMAMLEFDEDSSNPQS